MCEIESAIVIYVTLKIHHTESIMVIGTVAFPAPLIIPAIECESANRQKNSASILDCLTPIATTDGSELNSEIKNGAKVKTIKPIASESTRHVIIPNLAPFFALSYSFAPRF